MTLEERKLGGTTLDERITASYDPDGLLSTYEQKDGAGNLISSASYTRDPQGRTSQSAITYGKVDGGSFSFTIGQSFNEDDQPQSHTWPDGSQQTYSYANGRLSKITLPNQSEISYQNYIWNAPTQIQTPGAVKSIGYDALQRPTSIEVKNQSAQILASRNFQYDPVGNITQIKSDLGQTDYAYDLLDRLTQARPDDALLALGLPLEQYSYDPVGNRTSSAHQPGAWRYNADNQLTQYPRLTPFSASVTPADTQVSYTPQGHTASETDSQGNKSYTYNAAERLVKYQTQGLEAVYRYDPFGRRIAKSVTQGANTTPTYFQYSEQGLMAETDQNGKIIKAYGFNHQSTEQWSTDPIWQANIQNGNLTNADTSYYYLHTDHLGTPVLATNAQGQIVWKAISEAFGATNAVSASNIAVNLRLPGQYLDAETASHYNFNRNYRPNQGRYLQSDPIGLDDGPNTYAYVMQNPINEMDSRGLFGDGLRNGGSKYFLGHGDFYCSNVFDYTSLDHDCSPWDSYACRKLHFRKQSDVQNDLDIILQDPNGCQSMKAYEYLMHQGQDYFSHTKKGYGPKLGHAWTVFPDWDSAAWTEAWEWTRVWADKWVKKCGCSGKGKCNWGTSD
jgi:RHS repeat-associated protein